MSVHAGALSIPHFPATPSRFAGEHGPRRRPWYAHARNAAHGPNLGVESMKLKVKVDEKGAAILKGGMPVWIDEDDGKEVAFNVPQMVADLSRSSGEAAGLRKELEDLSGKLASFDGLDPAKARAALDMAAKLDAGKLMESGKVDELKAQIGKAYEDKIASLQAALEKARAGHDAALKAKDEKIHTMLVRQVFDASPFLRDKTALTPDIAFSTWGKNFRAVEENGELVLEGVLNGQPLLSVERPGQRASPEECLQMIVNAHPQKQTFMRPAPGGSGTLPKNGPAAAGTKAMGRAAFEQMAPAEKARFMADGGTLND